MLEKKNENLCYFHEPESRRCPENQSVLENSIDEGFPFIKLNLTLLQSDKSFILLFYSNFVG